MIRAIVFDFDGTLIDSYRDIANALNETLARLGRPPLELESVKTMIGQGVRVLLERALKNEAPSLFEAARDHFRDAYQKRLTEETHPYPGIIDMLEQLARRDLLIAVATNKPSYFTDLIIPRLGLDRAGIPAWASADEVAHRKPHPAVVELALARAAKARDASTPTPTATEVAYVGDMPIDVETARRMGCRMIGVGWGFDPKGLLAKGPDAFIERPEALLDLIDAEPAQA